MQARIAQVGAATLGLAEQPALTAHLEIDFGEREAARMLDQCLEACSAVRRRLRRAVEEAVRLFLATPHATTQLMQLR